MSDLTAKEQSNVRTALRFLRVRCGRADVAAKALRVSRRQIRRILSGEHGVSAAVAVRVARLASVGVDEVLTGKYPPEGACPHCGHRESVP